jgi:hypothetical protein
MNCAGDIGAVPRVLYSLPIARERAVVNHIGQVDGPIPRKSNGASDPRTDPEREQVRKQLQKILESSVFHNSTRYASVLKYIVDQTLEGYGDQLKERTIGIDVFKRTPDYDTASDHAVRSAVAEVRKRLAQYYQQHGRDQLRIEVLPGSYMPQFRCIEEEHSSFAPAGSLPDRNEAGNAAAVPLTRQIYRRVWLRPRWLAAACLLLLGSLAALVGSTRSQNSFDSFWKPVLSSRAPVLLCIGNVEGGRRTPDDLSNPNPTLSLSDFHNSPFETVNVHDVITMTKFAGLMEARGRQFELKSQSDATFTDLQNGPTVLVGLLNNTWTERLMPKLRFTVEDISGKVTIRDRNNPSRQDWSVDYATPYLNVTRDYAIVLRMLDPKTEQMVVVAAGITVFGTFAAGDLLTSRNEMKKLAAIAPPGWEKKNMEIVLSTDVIRGRSGPATIIAAQFW